MKKLLTGSIILVSLALLAHVSEAITYYIRTDGGTAQLCNGTADAPYPGSGTNQACAWSHPFWALDSNGGWKIQGGDTLLIYSGSYQMGFGAPNTGWCSTEGTWDCHLPALPSGPSSQNPTRLLGVGWNSGCANPPELWGTQRADFILNLNGTSNALIDCFEITDHSGCVESHPNSSVACQRDTYPYGDWALVGIYAADSSNVTLRHLNIHGLAHTGIRAGRLTDWSVEDVRIAGNGMAGWDGDLQEGVNLNSNHGTLTFRRLTVEWSGCAESYPGGQQNNCWGQSVGGYGDGFGQGGLTGGHWIIEDSVFRYNTQDGIDMLYVREENSQIEIKRTQSYGNAGDQVKVNGPTKIENSLMVSNCGYFNGKSFTYNVGDCRAGGSALVFSMRRGSKVSVVNSTLVGQGDCLLIVGCDTEAVPACDGSEIAIVQNNIFQGHQEFGTDDMTCDIWFDRDKFYQTQEDYNVIHPDTKLGEFQHGSHDIFQDPLFVNANLETFDGHLQAGSPAIDSGLPVGSLSGLIPSDDLTRAMRPYGNGVDRGAYEYGATSPNLNPNPPNHPVRVIFIHHSTGENWLSDENGGLGISLMNNNYYVSDTNYGWGPNNIGDRTDIGNWWEWFRGPNSSTYLNALYNEGDQHCSYSRLSTIPPGENEIIMFKSCFPNSAFQGNPSDPVPSIDNNPVRGEGSGSEYHTVANAKGIYIDLLEYFRTHTDKLFIVITAPPLMESDTSASQAANARAFNNWLVNEWLTGYPYKNVAVFDFYNVLTSNGGNADTNDAGWETGNHHRWWNGAIQHIQTVANNMAAYPTGDSHPSQAGNLKATGEFVSLFNVAYNRWKGGTPTGWTAIPGTTPSSPALAWNPVANKLQMVVRSANDSIWTATFNSSGVFNNDWAPIPGATPSAPALAWNPVANKFQIVVQGSGGSSIWAGTFNSSGVFNNDWAPIPGATPSAPALAWNPVANKLQIVVQGSGGSSIWAGTFNSSGVFNNDWVNIPGLTPSSPALTWNPSTNELQMVVRGIDGSSIWAGTFNSSGGFNNDWTSIPGATPSSPALAWDASTSELCLVVRASNNSIWFATFNSSGSFNNDWVNLPGGTASPPGIAYLPSIGYLGIVVRASNDSLWRMLY